MRTLTFALLSLVATPALAQTTVASSPAAAPLRFTVGVDAMVRGHTDRSYRLFGPGRASVEGGVSGTAAVARLGRGFLDLGAGLSYSTDSGRWEEVNEATREQLVPSISAQVRWPVTRWLEPHLRIAGDLTSAKLQVNLSGRIYEDQVWAPGASAGAGFRLRTPVITNVATGGGLRFAGALVFEGGMHVGPPLSFALKREAPADAKVAADQIPTAPTAVGDLGRTEPYFRISFAILL